MADGPMDINEFWRIVREHNLETEHGIVMFCIIKLGESALCTEYLDSLPAPNVKDILNSSIPTDDRWLIHRAAWEGNTEIIDDLIERGTSSDRLNSWNETPFTVVDSAMEQGQYGQDHADKVKVLLRKATSTAAPPPPPRGGREEAGDDAMQDSLAHMASVQASMQFPGMQVTPAMMEAAKKMAEQLLPQMMAQMGQATIVDDGAWVKELKNGTELAKEERHVYVTEVAFEATEQDIRAALTERCGEIDKLYMPSRNMGKRTASYNHIASKLTQQAHHQGKAIVLFKEKSSVPKALLLTGDSIKGRPFMVTLSLKVAKAARKVERGQSEVDKLLGEYTKKKKYIDAKLTEKPEKGDLSWLEKLISGPEQTHCFISGVAFEASMSEIKRLLKKCGEVMAFHMPVAKGKNERDAEEDKNMKKIAFDAVRDKMGGPTHKGRAVVFFRDKRALSQALALNGFVVRGRALVVTRRRTTAKAGQEGEARRQEAREARKRKREAEQEDSTMPQDIDFETSLGRQESEARKAQAWTDRVSKAAQTKSEQESMKAARKVSVPAAKKRKTVMAAASAEPEDDFEQLLEEHKRKRAARLLAKVVVTGPIGPGAEPAAAAAP
jgi:hypothetical protein